MESKTRNNIVLIFALVNIACVLLLCLGIFVYLFFFGTSGTVIP